MKKNVIISIIGLGYVGLPLAIEFSRKYKVIAYDLDKKRIEELKKNNDKTNEINRDKLRKIKNIFFTNNKDHLKDSNTFIITVPTPINKKNIPDLKYIKKANEIVGSIIKKNDVVILESTVYPGLTEEFCVPILEKKSKLIFNKDFFCGYSPERINPGKNNFKISQIKKITSGSNKKTAKYVDEIYSNIIKAGTYKCPSIKIAEAAKVIENCQRDLNVAFVNELVILFNKLNLNTTEILKAAKTKWNFLDFRPGLVGGHCIGVDPYYLTYKAKKAGYEAKTILAGRNINEKMGSFFGNILIKEMNKMNIQVKNSNAVIMGFAFKENCSDIRNTKVIDIIKFLTHKKVKVDVYDPMIDPDIAKKMYNINLIKKPKLNNYDSIMIAVSHSYFKKIGINKIKKYGKAKSLIFDLKNLFNKHKMVDITL